MSHRRWAVLFFFMAFALAIWGEPPISFFAAGVSLFTGLVAAIHDL